MEGWVGMKNLVFYSCYSFWKSTMESVTNILLINLNGIDNLAIKENDTGLGKCLTVHENIFQYCWCVYELSVKIQYLYLVTLAYTEHL